MPDTHDLPSTASNERMHDLSRDCWCGPSIAPAPGRFDECYVIHREERDTR